MTVWRCSCPVCRLLVHPVLRRAGGSSAAEARPVTTVAEQEAPKPQGLGEIMGGPGAGAETVGETPGMQTPPLAQPQQPVITEEIMEGLAAKISEGIREVLEGSNKVLVERLERIEENVGKLRKEIQGLVSSMENMIVEFREALSELNNPFAMASRPGIGPAALGGAHPPLPGNGDSKLVALIQSLRQLIEQVGLKTVEELIDEYVKAGVLKEEEARKIKAIALTLDKLRGKKLDESTLIPLLVSG